MSDGHQCYLVLDQGGHASRAIVFDCDGNIIDEAECAVSTQHLSDSVIEQDPAELVASIEQAAKQVYERLSSSYQNNLHSAALICQRSSIAVWNGNSQQALYNIISWQDRRAAKWLSSVLESGATKQDIYQRTGLMPNAHFGASKIHWVLKNITAAQQALSNGELNCGPLASYLIQQLSEEHHYLVDAGNASRTMLWNISDAQWDEHLLKIFDIPLSVLPSVKPCQYEYGHIRLKGSHIPLSFVNGDQNAAFFSHGSLESGTVYINLGTGGFCAALGENNAGSTGLLKTLAIMLNEPVFMLEGTVNGAASALAWAERELGIDVDYHQLNKELMEGASEILFINGVGGLGSPDWQSEFTSEFIGDGSNVEKLTAVVDSILFLLQRNMDCMAEQGIAIQKIQLGGGLAESDGLCQRLADLSRKEVSRSGVLESSARGAAFWLAGCPSHWKNNVAVSQFSPKSHAINRRYEHWRKEMGIRLMIV